VAPLRFSEQDEGVPGNRILGEIAAWHLTKILQRSPLPDDLVTVDHRNSETPVSFKTGTSYGSRDAWAVGFNDTYTVGVWVGRPDGTPSPGHYGLNTAAPLLFKVFGMLPNSKVRQKKKLPPGVMSTEDGPPEALRRFHSGRASPAPLFRRLEGELRIVFPPDGSTIEATTVDGEMQHLLLEANGGVRPLFWIVNGIPIDSSPLRRKTIWKPDGRGFTRLTVIDSRGKSVSVQVRLD